MGTTFAVFTAVIVGILAFTLLSIVKTIANRGAAQWGKDANQPVPPLFEKMFAKAVSERDEKIRKLDDRVAVLEKIVTDSHGASKLADEIESLRS